MKHEMFTYEEALAIARISRMVGAALGPSPTRAERRAMSRTLHALKDVLAPLPDALENPVCAGGAARIFRGETKPVTDRLFVEGVRVVSATDHGPRSLDKLV